MPPFAGASPAEIRAALLAGERSDYQPALKTAAETLTLDELAETLECWRRIAWSTADDPEAHRRMLRAAAARISGEPVPADEPLERTKARIGF